MKKLIVMAALLSVSIPAFALASKSCDELKSEIAHKLDAKGISAYMLDIVPTEDLKNEKVVGTCEAGTSKITYERSASKGASVKEGEPKVSLPTTSAKPAAGEPIGK